MSGDTVLRVEGLGKRYRLGTIRQAYGTLRDTFSDVTRKLFNRQTPTSAPSEAEMFWALKDINFEVKQGEVLGIIGRNGSGKSTLLKILSCITSPTEGQVELRGRVGTLLEVGTGFHPELTGRENIFLNGAILGMTRFEIKKLFDEIVDFSGVEKFIDTPVKRYSSGMYVRLAFAVAAHLDPEILLVDEVLAVGDIQFQKKCLGKMEQVAKTGRTVLFVSHNMAAMRRLCERVILISAGQIALDGPSEKTISEYLFQGENPQSYTGRRSFGKEDPLGDDFVQLEEIKLVSNTGELRGSFRMDESFRIEFYYNVLKTVSNFHLYIRIHTLDGVLAFCSADWDKGEVESNEYPHGQYTQHVDIPSFLLNRGQYMLTIIGVIPSVRVLFQDTAALVWNVTPEGGVGGVESIQRQGIIRPLLNWKKKGESDSIKQEPREIRS